MQVVSTWTGRQADLLRQAFRMSNESFAERLGISVRTVAYWRKRPDMVPVTAMQGVLDTALEDAPDQVKAKFSAFMEGDADQASAATTPEPSHPEKLNADEQERIRRVIHAPNRLDANTIVNLTNALVGQRHAEDTIGPDMIIGPMSTQRDVLEALLRNSHGPHVRGLTQLVANWTTFIGWLHTERHEHSDAETYFTKAEEMADEIGDGILAATATSYRGYLALLQGRYRAAIRATTAAIATPGAHRTQVAYDHLQAAQAYAGLGDSREARNLLRQASEIVTTAGDPPESVYWYTEPFLRMNIGLAQYSIGQYADASDSLRSGLNELPPDWEHAEWLDEYRQALDRSEASEDE